MTWLKWAMLLLCIGCCQVQAFSADGGTSQPRVAVVYSMLSGGTYSTEFDAPGKLLGWSVDKYVNTDAPTLMKKLPEYQFVVFLTAGNFTQQQNFGAYASEWMSFLNGGGGLVILDANYDNLFSGLLYALGDEFRIKSETIKLSASPDMSQSVRFPIEHPLLTIPTDVKEGFRLKRGNWGEFVSWPKSWTSLVETTGRSVALYRPVGKGGVLALSNASFYGAPYDTIIAGLMTNLRVYLLGQATGIKVVGMDIGAEVAGQRDVKVSLKNESNASQKLGLRITTPEGTRSEGSQTVAQGETAVLSVPMLLSPEPKQTLLVDLMVGDKTVMQAQRRINVHRPLELWVPDAHLSAVKKYVRVLASVYSAKSELTGELVFNIEGRPVGKCPIKLGENRLNVVFNNVAVGKHSVKAQLVVDGKVLSEDQFSLMVTDQTPVSACVDGRMVVDGKDFLPLGFYHVSWRLTPEHRQRFLEESAAAGFTVAHIGFNGKEDGVRALKEAEKLGIRLMPEGIGEAFEPYMGYKSIIAWSLADEVDLTIPNERESFGARSVRAREKDPSRLTYTLVYRTDSMTTWAGSTQMLGTDHYPVPGTVSTVYGHLRQLVTACERVDTVPFAAIQCFGYQGGALGFNRVPTAAEVRNMTWQALAAGTRGILIYAWADLIPNGAETIIAFDVRWYPELYTGLKKLPGEILPLQPFLLRGQRSQLASKTSPDVVGAVWTLDASSLVVLINTATTEQQVETKLPDDLRKGSIVGPEAKGLSLNGGVILGRLAPLSVEVMTLK